MTMLAQTEAGTLSQAAKRQFLASEGEALARCALRDALLIHYALPPQVLQPHVPFELDVRDQSAFVSLVVSRMDGLRVHTGHRLVPWVPVSPVNGLLFNVRTYVRHRGESGVFFMRQWVTGAVLAAIGPRWFGLPLARGRMQHGSNREVAGMAGQITATGIDASARLSYQVIDIADASNIADSATGHIANADDVAAHGFAAVDSLDEFLLERYVGFTQQKSVQRRLAIWHEPWLMRRVEVQVCDEGLLGLTGTWALAARQVAAHRAADLEEVWIGRPTCVNGEACGTHWSPRG